MMELGYWQDRTWVPRKDADNFKFCTSYYHWDYVHKDKMSIKIVGYCESCSAKLALSR